MIIVEMLDLIAKVLFALAFTGFLVYQGVAAYRRRD